MSDADVADLAALGSGDGLVRVVAVVCIAALLTPASDDQAGKVRLLLLGKGVVSAHGSSVRSLLGWTTTSSRGAGPEAIATRDCASWRGIARAFECASTRYLVA